MRFDTLRPFHVRRAGAARFETVRHEPRLAVLPDQLLRRLRDLDAYVEIPVVEAFDLVACVPEIGQSR